LNADCSFSPGRAALDYGVGVDEELSCACDESFVVGFSSCDETGIELDQRIVPTEGCRQGGGEERTAQTPAATGDVSLALMLSAVVVEGRKAGQGGGLLSADATEFWHADDEGD